jgi:signal transduction histidine kinase
LDASKNTILLNIIDDRKSADKNKVRKNIYCTNMLNRVFSSNGTAVFKTLPEKGFYISAELPLEFDVSEVS